MVARRCVTHFSRDLELLLQPGNLVSVLGDVNYCCSRPPSLMVICCLVVEVEFDARVGLP